eukprot:TRINITY_DN3285_c0_g1_i3.p1 TRINITY_DN3285_c0_g1~~TRINITY_DN3285_c0_g1_i3.p1  ORF type:complete len:167 (-),score=17.55 TRINITY_DN3285_c0_g1_i3:26-526(-)
MIRHDDGTWGMYIHLKKGGVKFEPGDEIKGKTLIGYSGNTGYSNGAHLHFQVTKASRFGHPLEWISETVKVNYMSSTGTVFVPKQGQTWTGKKDYPTSSVNQQISKTLNEDSLKFPPRNSALSTEVKTNTLNGLPMSFILSSGGEALTTTYFVTIFSCIFFLMLNL